MTRDEATQSGRVVTMPIERYQRYQEAERQVAAVREALRSMLRRHGESPPGFVNGADWAAERIRRALEEQG